MKDLYNTLGAKWKEISKMFVGRSHHAVKQKYNRMKEFSAFHFNDNEPPVQFVPRYTDETRDAFSKFVSGDGHPMGKPAHYYNPYYSPLPKYKREINSI